MINQLTYDLELKVTNTHRHLMKALYALVCEQPFETIKVVEICERANVSRSNFYNHFEDKYHLLFFYFAKMKGKLLESCSEQQPMRQFNEFLSHLKAHQPFFNSLLSGENSSELAHVIETLLFGFVVDILDHSQNRLVTEGMDLQSVFLLGGITKLTQGWVKTACQTEIKNIEAIVGQFVCNGAENID